MTKASTGLCNNATVHFSSPPQIGRLVLRGDAAGVRGGQRDQPGAHADAALDRRVPGGPAGPPETDGESVAPLHQQRRRAGNRPAG